MLDRTATKFSHVKPGDTDFKHGGLRDFFLYRDLGIEQATGGEVNVSIGNLPDGWPAEVPVIEMFPAPALMADPLSVYPRALVPVPPPVPLIVTLPPPVVIAALW